MFFNTNEKSIKEEQQKQEQFRISREEEKKEIAKQKEL